MILLTTLRPPNASSLGKRRRRRSLFVVLEKRSPWGVGKTVFKGLP
jgi:hypothetical protein